MSKYSEFGYFNVVLCLLAVGLIVSCHLVATPRGAYFYMSPCGCSLRRLLFHVVLWLLATGLIVLYHLVAARCGAYCFISSYHLVAARCGGLYFFMSPCGYTPRG